MTNANALPHRKSLRPALLWAAGCLLMLGLLVSLLPGARLNSSVLAMLPTQTLGAISPALNDGFMQRLDRQLVWLVSPGKTRSARGAAVADAAATQRSTERGQGHGRPGQQAGASFSGSTATG